MPMRVEQTPELTAGRARVLSASPLGMAAESLEIAIVRVDRGSPMHLDPAQSGAGVWTAAQRWIRPEQVRAGDGLSFELGPRVTFHLRPHTPYRVLLRDGSGTQAEDRVTWAAIRLPSEPPGPQAAEPAFAEAPAPDPLEAFAQLAAQAAAQPVAPPPPPRPDVRPDRRPHPGDYTAPRSARWPWVLLGLGLIGAVGAYEFLRPGGLRDILGPTDTPPVAAAPAPAPDAVTPDAPTPQGAIPTTVAGAREYLNGKRPSVEEALAQADRFEAAATPQGFEGAFLILKYAERQGSPQAALRLARVFDPALFKPGQWPVPTASPDDAVFYYVKAAEAGDVDAMLRAGELYHSGTASAADSPERAAFWLRKAAAAGSAKAKDLLK